MVLPEYDPAYDPVEHIESMGFTLIRHTLRDAWAITIPHQKRVLWDPKMPAHIRKPVLSHEGGHIENNDPGGHHPRNEARADLHAALRNVNPAEWDSLMGLHHDYDAICIELGITRAQFRAYYAHDQAKKDPSTKLVRLGDWVYDHPKMGAGQWKQRVRA